MKIVANRKTSFYKGIIFCNRNQIIEIFIEIIYSSAILDSLEQKVYVNFEENKFLDFYNYLQTFFKSWIFI